MNTEHYRAVRIIFTLLLSVISFVVASSQNAVYVYKLTYSHIDDLDRKRLTAYLQLNDDSTFIYRSLFLGRPSISNVLSTGTWISEGDTITLCSDDKYSKAPIFSKIDFDFFVDWIQFNELKLLQDEDSTLYCYPYKDAACHLVRHIRYCNVIKARTKSVCFYEDGHPRRYSVFDEHVDVKNVTWTLTPATADSILHKFINQAYQLLERK